MISLDDESSQEENPNYLHTMPYLKLSPSDMVGLRTSKHKYFRAARDPKEDVNLYDLKNVIVIPRFGYVDAKDIIYALYPTLQKGTITNQELEPFYYNYDYK